MIRIRSICPICMLVALLVPSPAFAALVLDPPDEGAAVSSKSGPAAISPQERLQGLQRQVGELGAATHIQKLRLQGLAAILGREQSSGALTIVHQNQVSSMYKLVGVSFSIDGKPVQSQNDEQGIARKPEIEVFRGSLAPGNHVLSTSLVYRGNGGPFSYFTNYTYTVRASHDFSVDGGGKRLQLKVVSLERGSPFLSDFATRAGVDFRASVPPPPSR